MIPQKQPMRFATDTNMQLTAKKSEPLSLVEINSLIDRRSIGLKFPEPVETEYMSEFRTYRTRLAWAILLPSIAIYNAFLCIDFYVLPRTFWLAVGMHIGVTAIILGSTYFSTVTRGAAIRDALFAAIPIAMVAQISAIAMLNEARLSEHYQYISIMILVFMNISYKLEHRHTIIATGILTAIYLVTLVYSGVSPQIFAIASTMTAAAAYLTLSAHRRMERDARYSFLRRMQDLLSRREAEVEAGRDPLTGLSNRRSLDARIEELWRLDDDKGSPVSVVMVDIDHFKSFNDRYGHQSGDLCLKRVANTISQCVRDDDCVFRFGGEEFLVLLPRTSLAEASQIANRARQAISSLAIPHEVAKEFGIVTASFGVMTGPTSAHSAEELIRGADAALYAAKRDGRNRVWPISGHASGDQKVVRLVETSCGRLAQK